jgi:hypothetical protein
MLRGGPAGLPGDFISLPLYHAPKRLADVMSRRARARTIGNLSEFGLPVPAEGPFSLLARTNHVPSLVDPDVIDAIRDGSIEVVGTMDGFDDGGVRLINGRRLDPDAVICATGYMHGLEALVGHLGVLDDRGLPRISGENPRRAWTVVHRVHSATVADRLRRQAVTPAREEDRERLAEKLRLQHDIRHQSLVLDVRLVFDSVEQLALLLTHVGAVLRRAGNADVVGDDDGSRMQPAAVEDALQVWQVRALVVVDEQHV